MTRRLELASGYAPYRPDDPEWEHLDINPNAPHVDHVADAFAPLPFPDATFAELRAADCLEHASWRDTDTVLAEWARISEPGAALYVQVPDAALVMRWLVYDDDRLRKIDTGSVPPIIGAAWRLLGGGADGRYVTGDDDWRWNLHASLFDREYLTYSLDRAGFTVESCLTNGHPNLMCNARRR